MSEKIYLSDGSEMHATTLINVIVKAFDGLHEYQFRQNRVGALEIRVVADEQFTQQAENELKDRITGAFQLDDIDVTRVEHIKKTVSGKRVPFVSKIHA